MSIYLHSYLKTTSITLLALIAFAANSVLCRLALSDNTIDPASFTIVRLVSGILVLLILTSTSTKISFLFTKGSWLSSTMLFIYAVTFSYAYITLDTGTGALLLFAAVQITLILSSLLTGNRLHIAEWVGILLAFSGLIYLVSPQLTSPSFAGFILMTISGISWGLYTLRGKSSTNPLIETSANFLKTLPFILLLIFFSADNVNFSTKGIYLAMLSGGITSGLGYAIWYMALKQISTIHAAIVQLLVPIIAALGGIIFVAESITTRFIISTFLVLSGILIVLLKKYYSQPIKV